MEKRLVKKKQSNSEERRGNSEINDLPDPLLCHILSFLSTKDSARSSVLSKSWRNLWLQVPVFDLDVRKFDRDIFSCTDFVDRFLKSDENLTLNRFKLICYYDDIYDDGDLQFWIDALVERRVCHLDFQVRSNEYELFCMPLTLYSCNTLASLSLYNVALSDMKLEFVVSLPCLKVMHLDSVRYEYDKSLIRDGSNYLETLITSCPVLEKLTIIRDFYDHLKIMRVRSKSLKNFTLCVDSYAVGLLEDHVVEIDAPRLEYMSLLDDLSGSIIIHRIAPYAVVDIDVNFDGKDGYTSLDQDDDDDSNSKRTMIRNFLSRISTVCRMEISSNTLEFIHDFSKLEPLPQFSNLTWLYASFVESFWELLPTFLGCCPNLHTLALEFKLKKEGLPIELSYVPPCFVSSLKYVELKTTSTTKTSSQMKLARYFLKNCAVLKKLSLSKSFGDDIINGIKKIKRKSRKCIIVTGCLLSHNLYRMNPTYSISNPV